MHRCFRRPIDCRLHWRQSNSSSVGTTWHTHIMICSSIVCAHATNKWTPTDSCRSSPTLCRTLDLQDQSPRTTAASGYARQISRIGIRNVRDLRCIKSEAWAMTDWLTLNHWTIAPCIASCVFGRQPGKLKQFSRCCRNTFICVVSVIPPSAEPTIEP